VVYRGGSAVADELLAVAAIRSFTSFALCLANRTILRFHLAIFVFEGPPIANLLQARRFEGCWFVGGGGGATTGGGGGGGGVGGTSAEDWHRALSCHCCDDQLSIDDCWPFAGCHDFAAPL